MASDRRETIGHPGAFSPCQSRRALSHSPARLPMVRFSLKYGRAKPAHLSFLSPPLSALSTLAKTVGNALTQLSKCASPAPGLGARASAQRVTWTGVL